MPLSVITISLTCELGLVAWITPNRIDTTPLTSINKHDTEEGGLSFESLPETWTEAWMFDTMQATLMFYVPLAMAFRIRTVM